MNLPGPPPVTDLMPHETCADDLRWPYVDSATRRETGVRHAATTTLTRIREVIPGRSRARRMAKAVDSVDRRAMVLTAVAGSTPRWVSCGRCASGGLPRIERSYSADRRSP